MPIAREWADEFEQGIKNYGISAEQIQRYSDSDSDTVKSAIRSAKHEIIQNAKRGRRTLLLCFYAGHGATINNQTVALFGRQTLSGLR